MGIRNYGLGDPTQYITSTPTVVCAADCGPCIHCGCDKMYLIELDVKHPALRGEIGKAHYIGCPACPYASPMMMVSVARG